MKILFFVDSLRAGGKERRIVELVKGLSKSKKHEIQFVLTKRTIHYEEILSMNIKIHFVERTMFKKDPKVFFKFYEIARKFKPDIIHVWENMVAIYSIPAKLLLNIPLINNQITDAPQKVKSTLFSHKITFPFSDLIISNTQAGLQSYNAPINKSKVIYNGFDFKRIAHIESKEKIRDKFNINTAYVVGMVASYSKEKDYISYIRAASHILKTRSDITFICVGAGNFANFKELVDPKFAKGIIFISEQKEIESIMNTCDMGVLMTNAEVHGEGISNALLEFMALEKPVIANNSGGNPELIESEKNGFLISNGDYVALAEKVLLLINNRALMEEFGRRSKQIVTEKFNIDQMIMQFEDCYNQMYLLHN